ncbi:cytosol nonspecific dipeptidase [Candidatus Heimdallarchaeota archaeon]|nr:MAG: cytosol nonspecific dipeptidase [Candidatus Gerdarchaeota archaeon]RLI73326.1 MAG: cytosol nonspecific dipeptidase [Candidatus Heimdallarchaeota archaeon]
MTEKILTHLQPERVWSIFEEITKIPRPSKKEQKIRQWIKEWAKQHKIPIVKEDDVGNLLLAADAHVGCEDFATIVLQAHMDMVCQKSPGVEIDFENDPLKIRIDGDKVRAIGTSLGADNGIGLAYCLAALSDHDLKRGPLEVLLTVDEETGLTGAFNIKKGFFTGKYLLNVDSEETGKITISSAGGGGTEIIFPISLEEQKGTSALSVKISGLLGGHSGVDIDKPRLNAIKVGIDSLQELEDKIRLVKLEGGSAHNAIPRDFEFEIVFAKTDETTVIKHIEQWRKNTLKVATKNEPTMKIELTKSKATRAFSKEQTMAILATLQEIKHGPIAFSKEIRGLVQTSSNLALVKTSEKEVSIFVSTRSSDNKELEEVREEIKKIGERHHAQVRFDKAYPGWKPEPDAAFVQMVKKAYESVIKKPVTLEAIHAGLECGLFATLDPEIQIASIGPNIANAHSPDEYVEIESVEILWNVIKEILARMNIV